MPRFRRRFGRRFGRRQGTKPRWIAQSSELLLTTTGPVHTREEVPLVVGADAQWTPGMEGQLRVVRIVGTIQYLPPVNFAGIMSMGMSVQKGDVSSGGGSFSLKNPLLATELGEGDFLWFKNRNVLALDPGTVPGLGLDVNFQEVPLDIRVSRNLERDEAIWFVIHGAESTEENDATWVVTIDVRILIVIKI